jgi:hypothetical protein
MRNGREFRATPGGELRAAGPGLRISGYAAVFDSVYECGGWTESIRRGAFKPVLSSDVRCLFNHAPENLLARTKSGTLSISEDSKGLAFEAELPSTPTGRDVYAMIQRADLDGCSFSFTVDEEQWSDHGSRREIVKLRDLYDVGPVTFPAYTGTSVGARSQSLRNYKTVGFARSASGAVYVPAVEINLARERARLQIAIARGTK